MLTEVPTLKELPMLKEVTIKEIQAIFEVTDGLGLSREELVIPLMPRAPGGVRRRPDGKLEIVVDAEADFGEFLAGLSARIQAAG